MEGILREIEGFPGYLYNSKTSEVISMRQKRGGLILKVTKRAGVPMITMFRDGIPRGISMNRLKYAIEHEIDYDRLPKSVYVVTDEKGGLSLMNDVDMVTYARKSLDKKAKQRVDFINEKIKRLEMIRKVYISGDISIVLGYIEKWKSYFIGKLMHSNNCKAETAELIYAETFELFAEKLRNEKSLITDFVVYYFGLMKKTSRKRHKRIMKANKSIIAQKPFKLT